MNNLVLHKAIQGFKHHKILVSFWLIACIFEIYIDPILVEQNFYSGRYHNFKGFIKVFYAVTGFLLTVSVIQKDPLHDEDEFWLTKPMRSKDLLLGNLLFLGIAVVVTPTLLTAFFLILNGESYNLASEVALIAFILHLLCLLVIILMSALTNDALEFFISISILPMYIFLIFYSIGFLVKEKILIFDENIDESFVLSKTTIVAVTTVVALFVILSKHYLKRNRKKTILALAAYILLTPLIFMAWNFDIFSSYTFKKPQGINREFTLNDFEKTPLNQDFSPYFFTLGIKGNNNLGISWLNLNEKEYLENALAGYQYLGNFSITDRSQLADSRDSSIRTHRQKNGIAYVDCYKYVRLGEIPLQKGASIKLGSDKFEIFKITEIDGTINPEEFTKMYLLRESSRSFFSYTREYNNLKFVLINKKKKQAISIETIFPHRSSSLRYLTSVGIIRDKIRYNCVIQDNFGYSYKSKSERYKNDFIVEKGKKKVLDNDAFIKSLKRDRTLQISDEWLKEAVLVIYRKDWQGRLLLNENIEPAE